MKRRSFIKNSLTASSGIIFVDSVLGNISTLLAQKPESPIPFHLDAIYEGFKNPPTESKLFVRWWWNGNRVNEKEILRELDLMKEAGIGGVEINPVAFPADADPVGNETLRMFSREWLEMLQVALRGAKERGMVCDMIVGSGWPFGGEFLEKDEQSQMATIGTEELEGGREYKFSVNELLGKVNPQIYSKNEPVYKEIKMVRLLPKESDKFIEGEDLTKKIKGDDLTIRVPDGKHVLYYVVKLTGFMAVILGAPGAAGPVLNHYSRDATEKYLDRISGFISGQIGDMGNYIRAMFCDSMELEGANWVDDLPDEFEKRRGYSLMPYLPFVLKKVGHMGNPVEEDYGTVFPEDIEDMIGRIELDLYKTRIELFRERFLETFTEWCHRNNVKSRMQAYGRGMHPLEASMEIDIPEAETWLSNDLGESYPDIGLNGRAPRMVNKYVSSAAVLSGKKIVSCEEVTNTGIVFMASLEVLKIAGDQTNISGINHSILHGFNYSPPDAPFPGWIRYGTYFNERNTWWPYFPKWAAYKSRISFMLQNATPRANIAILQPLTDLWLKYGPQRDPFPRHWYPDYQNNLWEAIHQNGGGCDYVSEMVINSSKFTNGLMIYNDRSYDTLLMPGIETLDIKTAGSLERFAVEGGRIVFIGTKPVKSPDFINSKKNDLIVRHIIDDLLEKDNVQLYHAPEGEVINWYGKLQDDLDIKPYVSFDRPNRFLSQASYMAGRNPVFFIANTSLNVHISVVAEFNLPKKLNPWIWNPETGERFVYPYISDNKINLELPGASSALIVMQEDSDGDFYKKPPFLSEGKEVEGSWQVRLNHISGNSNDFDISSIAELPAMEIMESFAGEIIYRKNIQLDDVTGRYIDLGIVKGISEVELNGKILGSRWYGAHIYDTEDKFKKGSNSLKIKVTTIIGNYIKSLKNNSTAQTWTRHQVFKPQGIIGPVRII